MIDCNKNITIFKEDIIKDYDLLIQEGVVGFYNRCEIIEIFGYSKKQVFNIFTLVVFEKSNDTEEKFDYLTSKLNNFSNVKGIKWGINKHIVSLERCHEIFDNIINNGILKIAEDISEVGEICFERKKYIHSDQSLEKVQVNKVLKNNFSNGSYIIEGFDVTKKHLKFLIDNPVCLNKFSEEVSSIIPISIGSISDRLGNIIFQFPIRLFNLEYNPIKPDKGVELQLYYDESIKVIPKLKLILFNNFDGVIKDFKIQDIKEHASIFMSTSNNVDMKIINPENDLILSYNKFYTLKGFNISGNIISNQNRVFSINEEYHEIRVTSCCNFNGLSRSKNIDSWIYDRKYEQELKNLETTQSFIQYYGNKDDSKKALNDIRSLIQKYGRNGVYIWDPYLSAIDIKNTLYYTPYSDVPLRAITNLCDVGSNNKNVIINKFRNEFIKDNPNYLLMNLEVRCKRGNNGWGFHDRFLIFPLEKPKVWSLGISVNQLGKSHHILQEVRNSQHILNAFNQLWDELKGQECLVWKSM